MSELSFFDDEDELGEVLPPLDFGDSDSELDEEFAHASYVWGEMVAEQVKAHTVLLGWEGELCDVCGAELEFWSPVVSPPAFRIICLPCVQKFPEVLLSARELCNMYGKNFRRQAYGGKSMGV